MCDVRKEERKLYAECQLLKSMEKNEKLKKKDTWKIHNQRQKADHKHDFFKKFILAYEKVGRSNNEELN